MNQVNGFPPAGGPSKSQGGQKADMAQKRDRQPSVSDQFGPIASELKEETAPPKRDVGAALRLAAAIRRARNARGSRVSQSKETLSPQASGTPDVPPRLFPHIDLRQTLKDIEARYRKTGRPVIHVDGEKIEELRGVRTQPVFARACRISVDALQRAEKGHCSKTTIKKIAAKLMRDGVPVRAKDLIKKPTAINRSK